MNEGSSAATDRHRLWWSMLPAVLLCILVLHVLLVAAPRERARFVAAACAQREAMADDRAAAIDAWLRGGIDDARLLAAYPTVEHLAAGRDAAVADPGIGPRAHLEQLLGGFLSLQEYATAAVVSGDLDLVGASPKEYVPGPAALALARACLATGEAAARVYLSPGRDLAVAFVAPVRAAGPDRRVVGVVVLREDPRRWLFPFIAHHPQVSGTGETVLVQRNGDDLLYIAPLRHSDAPAGALSVPITAPNLAAASAFSGERTFGRYLDYRGVAVFAAPRLLRSAPWGLVAKVDEAEVMAPFHRWLVGAAALVAALAVASGGLVYGIRRREADRRALALARSEAELARLLDQASDAVLSVSRAGVIVRANRYAEAMYGYTADELRGMTLAQVRPPAESDRLAGVLEQIAASGRWQLTEDHVRRDGRVFPVEASTSFVDGPEGGRFLVIARDISERRRNEERIGRLNRLLRTISEINQLVVRERDPQALLAAACRIVVEMGGLALVWVGRLDVATGEVRPVASAGAAAGAVEAMQLRLDDPELGRAPTAAAVRDRRRVVVDEWAADATVAPPPAWARAAGLRSVAAFSLAGGELGRGSVTACSREPAFFDDEIVALLEEMVADLAFALDAIADRDALERQDRLLREMSRMAKIGGWEFDAATGEGTWTEEVARIHGLDPSIPTNAALGLSFYTPESRARIEAAIAAATAGGAPYDLELELVAADGARKWVRTVGVPEMTDGRAVRVAGIFQDIGERKRIELALVESNRRLQDLVGAIKALAAARELDDVAAVVRSSARRLVGADGITFVLRDDGHCHYIDEDAVAPLWKGQRFPLHACISGWSMLNLAVAVVPDVFADPRVPAEAYRPTFVKSLAMVPIGVREGLGAIGAYWATTHTATDAEVALLQTLADVAARAVENVRLLAELERRVEQRTAQLVAANRELESFSYSVSHDLRAPLRAVDGFSRILQEDYGTRLDDEAQRLIGVVRENTRRMGQLIDDLLAFSRLGRAELRREMVDMRALAEAVAAEVRHAGEYAGAELVIGELPAVLADPGLVRQVWSNLLSNAFKFSSRVPRPHIEVRGRLDGRAATYEVVDNGAGFDTRYADKLFGVFQRLHTAAEFPGTGVGLALVQRIVARHGGRVWADGAPRQGALFGFSIPADRGEDL